MLENCRWLLHASRLYGCHPHTIRERPATDRRASSSRQRRSTTTTMLALYTAIACGAYCAAAYRSADLLPCVSANAMIVGCALQRIDRYVRTLYMILTAPLSWLRRADLERAVTAARRFDALTRQYRRRRRRRHRCADWVQWPVIIAIHVLWLIFGALLLLLSSSNGRVYYWSTIAARCATRAAFSIQVAKFCFLYDALRRRFRRLNQLCRELAETTPGTSAGRRPTVTDLQRSHRYLADAANHLSTHYSPQLFCWIACMLTDILTYVFFVIYNNSVDPRTVSVQCLILLYLSLQVVAMSRVCHLTCDQANALASTVFSAEAAARFERIEYATEAIELGVHLRAHPLRVRVFGLFDLDSRFTFSTFGVILMYVILASSLH